MGGTPLSDKFYSSLKADSRVEEPSETDMKTFMKTNPKLRPENYPKIKPTTLAVTKPTHRHEHCARRMNVAALNSDGSNRL